MGSYKVNILKILIIDDDVDIIEMLKEQLERIGHEVEASSYGEDALNKVLLFKPDTIILDVFLGNESGFTLCKQLKAVSNAKIIMASAILKKEWEDLAKLYGADFMAEKPVSFDLLSKLLCL